MTGARQIGELALPGRLAPARKLALAGEVLLLHARVARLLRRHDIRGTVETLRGRDARDPGADPALYAASARLAKVATGVLGPLPLDSSCLRLSLVVCAVLARRGVAASVVIGVRGGERFGAHAWAEVGGRPVLPASGGTFQRLVEL